MSCFPALIKFLKNEFLFHRMEEEEQDVLQINVTPTTGRRDKDKKEKEKKRDKNEEIVTEMKVKEWMMVAGGGEFGEIYHIAAACAASEEITKHATVLLQHHNGREDAQTSFLQEGFGITNISPVPKKLSLGTTADVLKKSADPRDVSKAFERAAEQGNQQAVQEYLSQSFKTECSGEEKGKEEEQEGLVLVGSCHKYWA